MTSDDTHGPLGASRATLGCPGRVLPTATVVIASHNRPDGLAACVEAIAAGGVPEGTELVVVDDGSQPPVVSDTVRWPGPLRVVRLHGIGPGGARNAGALRATGEILLFTDDDTLPQVNWISAAVDHLARHPRAIAVEGPVESPPWDPLYAYSIRADVGGHYWTCNIAYRRETFMALGGFRADVYPSAHGEDRDLALRALERGSIDFIPTMRITHSPRTMTPHDFRRRARLDRSSLILDALTESERHRPGLLGEPRIYSMLWAARRWYIVLRSPEARATASTRRFVRFVRVAAPALATSWWVAARTPSEARLRERFGVRQSGPLRRP